MWGAIRNMADHVQKEALNGIAGANQLLEQLDNAIEEDDDDNESTSSELKNEGEDERTSPKKEDKGTKPCVEEDNSSSDFEAVFSSIKIAFRNMNDDQSIETMRASAGTIQKKVGLLHELCNRQEQIIADVTQQFKSAVKESKSMKKDQAELETEINALKEELLENNAAANKYKQQVVALQKELKSEQDAGIKMKLDRDESERIFAAQQVALQADRAALSSKMLEEKNTLIDSLKSQLTTLSKDLDEERESRVRALEESGKVCERLAGQVSSLEAELRAAREAIATNAAAQQDSHEGVGDSAAKSLHAAEVDAAREAASREAEEHAVALESLQAKLVQVTKDLQNEREEFSKLEQVSLSNLEDSNKFSARVVQLEADLLAAQAGMRDTERTTEALISKLEKELAESEASGIVLAEEKIALVEELQAKTSSLEHELQAEREALSRLAVAQESCAAESLQEQASRLQEEHAAVLDELTAKVSFLQTELVRERDESLVLLEERTSEVGALRLDLCVLETAQREQGALVASMQEELQGSREELKVEKDLVIRLKQEHEAEACADSEVTVQGWMAQVSTLEADRESTTAHLQQLHNAVVSKLNETIVELEKELLAQREDSMLQVTEKGAEVAALQKQLSAAEDSLAKAAEEHNAMVEGLLKAQIDGAEQALLAEHEISTKKLEEKVVIIAALQEQVCALEKRSEEVCSLQAQLAAASQEKENAMTSLQETRAEMLSLKEQVSALEMELSAALDSSSRSLATLAEEIEQQRSQVSTSQEHISSLRDELADEVASKAEIERENRATVEALMSRVAFLEQDLAIEREQISAAGDNTNTIIESLNQEAESLQGELASVKASAAASLAEKDADAKCALARITELESSHAGALTEAAAEAESCRALAEAAQCRVATLEAELASEREASQRDKDEHNSLLQDAEAQLAAVQVEVAAERDALTKTKQSSKSKIDGLQVLVSSLEHDLKAEREASRKKEQAGGALLNDLQRQAIALNEELSAERACHAQDNAASVASADALAVQVSGLSAQLAAEKEISAKLSKDLHNLQFSEKDDGATIQSLKDEIAKKNKHLDLMKKKDFDTLRKQNETISHLQREHDNFVQTANEQIQALKSELLKYEDMQTCSQHHHETDSKDDSQVKNVETTPMRTGDVSEIVVVHADDDADYVVDRAEFKFKEKEVDSAQNVISPVELDLKAKVAHIESLEGEVLQLKATIRSMKDAHADELQRLQDMLVNKDLYISSVKEEQYRQEREIAQLEEVIFEKKKTRQKKAGTNSEGDGSIVDVEGGPDDEDDDDNYDGGGRGPSFCGGDKSSWGSSTPPACLSLWSCMRSACPMLLDFLGKRPPTTRACVLAYCLLLHLMVLYFFAKQKSGCGMSMPSLRGASA